MRGKKISNKVCKAFVKADRTIDPLCNADSGVCASSLGRPIKKENGKEKINNIEMRADVDLNGVENQEQQH